MEIRGNAVEDRVKRRPAIVRRSCDQCRSRKIGCDRGSPCSSCLSTRLECTHSAIASKPTPPKQRILISAQYERKIDDIARDIDLIKSSLGVLAIPEESNKSQNEHGAQKVHDEVTRPVLGNHAPVESNFIIPQWDHSTHVVDFVKAVVEESDPGDEEDESSAIISSLRSLAALMSSSVIQGQLLSAPKVDAARQQTATRMPPLDAVLSVLRWVKAHQDYLRINWISQILPLQSFEDVCRKVYFAVDDYSDIDFVLANGFLSYMFAEHTVSAGVASSRDHFQLCRTSLYSALLRLPIMSPPSLEVIAALTLGALNSVENSKATAAWSFISAALNHCQTLGYHRLQTLAKEQGSDQQKMQISLFWTVYKLEKGLSLRLGRPSGMRDAEITLPAEPDEHRTTRVGRIQGQVYDQLYSPAGLRTSAERGIQATHLAEEVRRLLSEIRSEISEARENLKGTHGDPMRAIYLHSDLVCHSSLLTLILRAVPSPQRSEVSDECAVAARDALEVHQQCIQSVHDCSDPTMISKYLNWAVIHVPFVPFSIMFTRVVQTFDFEDLALLDRFTASLKPATADEEIPTHPYRLYHLLSQAARLYITGAKFSTSGSTLATNDPAFLTDFEASQFLTGTELSIEDFSVEDVPMFDLGEWYQGNQQLISLLDEGILFQMP